MKELQQYILSLPPEYILGGVISSLLMFGTFLWFIKSELKAKQQFIVDNLLTTIESASSYADHIQQNIKPDTFLYKTYLRKTLNFLNKHLGELKVFSFFTWEKHFTYSLIYSFFFFYMVWLFGGSGNIGNLTFLPNENRLTTSLYLIFEIVAIYLLFTKDKQIQTFLAKKIPYFSQLSNSWQELVVGVVASVGVVGVVVGVIGEVGVVGGGVVGVVGVGVGVGVVVGVLLLLLNGLNSANILYLFFFLILPFINSIFDYISMYFSRLFAEKILKTDSKWEIFVDIIIDLAIALLLLFGLAFTLFYTLEYANSFITDEKLLIPIEVYKRQLLSNPFDKEVLWITLMFFSTLIPTLAHLVLGLYSLLALRVIKPHLGKVVDELNSLKDNDPNSFKKHLIAKELAVYELTGMLKLYIIIGVGILLFFIGSIFALLVKIGINIF